MLELNGELIKPQDVSRPTKAAALSDSAVEHRRRVELGSIQFDTDVSSMKSLFYVYCFGLKALILGENNFILR